MIRSPKMWVGMALSVVLIGIFLTTVDVGRMLDALADADYGYAAPAIGLYLVSLLFRTIRWQMLMRHMRLVKVTRLYPVVIVGYMANNLLPLRLGELVRSYYVSRREGVSKSAALATILVERVLDAVTLLMLIALIALFVPISTITGAFGERLGVPAPLLVFGFSAPFILALGLLIAFAANPEKTGNTVMAVLKPLPGPLRARVGGITDLFLTGLAPLRSPRTLTTLLILTLPIWLLEAGTFFLVGYSFDLDSAFTDPAGMAVGMVLLSSITNIGSALPAAPGGVGLFELVTRETLLLLPMADTSRSVAAAFSTVTHAVLLLPMIALGQLFLWMEHLSLRSLSSQAGSDTDLTPASDRRGHE